MHHLGWTPAEAGSAHGTKAFHLLQKKKARSQKLRTDLELFDTWPPPLDPSHASPRRGLVSPALVTLNAG